MSTRSPDCRTDALIFLDVDRFKSINDTHGHAVGDAVIKEVAARLRATLRATDTAARLAGDEFVIILEGLAEAAQARAVAVKLVEAIRVPMAVGDRSLHVTASMGLACVEGVATVDAKDLMARADRALYKAKERGRDGVCVAAA
jgi:diguanylate cyclase (GGDEF)-like protein